MTTPRKKVYDPGHPPAMMMRQEVMANGAACGHLLKILATQRAYAGSLSSLRGTSVEFPAHWFTEDDPRVSTPETAATRSQEGENLPILAWIVSYDGREAAVAVDIVERTVHRRRFDPEDPGDPESRMGQLDFRGGPPPPPDCKVIMGLSRDVLPPEILEKMGLS